MLFRSKQFCESNNIEPKVVISDVRLLDEVKALADEHARVWLIKREIDYGSSVPGHLTEQMDEGIYNFEAVLENNGTFNQLYNGVEELVKDEKSED